VALTDLVAGRLHSDSVEGGVRTRVVLDTSVLVGDPNCLHGFAGVDVVIPFTVIEELDGLKTRPTTSVARPVAHCAPSRNCA
jgi:hypothetical protein